MKNLLSMLAVSTLVGTSASNLKPMFTNTIVSHGLKSILTNNINMSNNPFISEFKDLQNKKIAKIKIAPNGTIYAGSSATGLWKSIDGINFNQVSTISNRCVIKSIDISSNGEIWVGTDEYLYFSNDNGISFNSIANDKIKNVTTIAIAPNGNIFVGAYGTGLWQLVKGDTDFKKIPSVLSSMIDSIAIAPNGNIFVGAALSYKGIGLYKSTDGTNYTNIYPNKNINSIAIAPNGTIYAVINTKLNKSIDGGNTFKQVNGISDGYYIDSIAIAPNGTIYVGTEKEGQRDSGLLYKSTDGTNFKSFSGIVEAIKCVYLLNGSIYYTTGNYDSNGDLFKANLIDNLLKVNKPDYFDNLYDGLVYKNEQKIDIKDKFIANATLDGKSITVPTTNLDISTGEHTLFLTLKDEYKQYLDLFDGDFTTGTATYKLWVKTGINKNDIKYSTNKDDTELYSGLVSNAGNTNGVDIIQTKNKNISVHQATLNSKFDDILIDYPNSYYVQGTVDDATNDFTVTGSKQVVSKNLSIKTDGIYHLHLEDTVGNIYDSYLELGESNWKLKGTFNDSELDKLKAKLNVTVNLTDPSQKSKALGWLHQYENFVENKFNETIKTNGKGFDSEIKNQISSYTSFLKSLTYDIANEPKFDDGLDKDLLVKTITDKAKEILNKGLDVLPKNLNVNTSNVVNKSTLEHYTNWINNYQYFINKNKDKWINEIEKIASRGFATDEQENKIKAQISQFLNNDNIKNYLKNIVWEDNKLLKATSNDYKQYIEIEKLQSDTINWVNTNMKAINIAYQQAIKNAESGLNLHGYSIDEILNGKQKPQTKNEIDNFAAGQSYHDWLQSQANIKFHGWQLTIGLSIGISLAVIFGFVGLIWYWKSDKKRKPYEVKGKKSDKQETMKKIKSDKKSN
ncbi:hypothetical protein [Spiroplasma endosymbiont of Danaus chrysippus]|uniref:hypothetical protein n=1 Tax=Spiroplasma endosymbiont of Danaus chrysippus TaxID=2691041 RepID=UPI0013CD700D|nr:hypothetical protein [Spiroplasma endosymbiont of Danaus chrysippus]CAB1054914.1 Glycosyl hydrolase, BNR repeat precursor [Spiroplasma endosymbiont of Danaus chrysippus]